jgi:hypothetical protein
MIDRVAKAQATADAKRLAALKEYMALLNGQSGNGSWNGFNNMPSFPEEIQDSNVTPFPRSTPGSFRRAEEQSNLTGPIQLTQMPTLTTPTASAYYDPLSSFNNRVDVTINAGVGDPEAIARAVEDVLNQSTYRGTSVNRGAGQYYV